MISVAAVNKCVSGTVFALSPVSDVAEYPLNAFYLALKNLKNDLIPTLLWGEPFSDTTTDPAGKDRAVASTSRALGGTKHCQCCGLTDICSQPL